MGQRILRPGEQRHRAVRRVAAGEGLPRLIHRLGDALGVAQDVPLAGEFLLLSHPQLGPLQLTDLVLEGVHPPGLLPLVHLHGLELAAQLAHLVIRLLVVLS